MKSIRNALLATVLVAATGSVVAAEQQPPQASIPFVNLRDSIYSWQAEGETGLFIQDIRKDWYYAKIMAPCPGLEFAPRLGFETKTLNSLDRFGFVVVPNNARCQITSLTKSEAPKDEKKSRKSESAPK